MKPKQAKETMIHVLRGGNTPLLIGGTGIGKSAVVKQTTYELADGRTVRVDKIDPNKNEFGFIDFRLSLYESIDLGGLCYIEEGKQLRAFLGNLPIKGEGILFLDEYGQAHPNLQSVCGQLIYERRIGEYTMPDGWQIVCASNRASDRAGSVKLPSHVIGRCSIIEFESDYNDWLDWAMDNDVHPHVMSYLNFRQGEDLNKFDPKVISPQPSPRSWVRLSDTLKTNPPLEIVQRLAECDVGEISAIDFRNFIQTFKNLPNIEAILNGSDVDNPYSDMESIKDKKEKQGARGISYAITIALVEGIRNADNLMYEYFENGLAYVSKFPTPEYKIFFVRMATRKRPELMETKTYSKFKIDNQDVEF
jgi:hypothetical protein